MPLLQILYVGARCDDVDVEVDVGVFFSCSLSVLDVDVDVDVWNTSAFALLFVLLCTPARFRLSPQCSMWN